LFAFSGDAPDFYQAVWDKKECGKGNAHIEWIVLELNKIRFEKFESFCIFQTESGIQLKPDFFKKLKGSL
jgi:hypothetical protein